MDIASKVGVQFVAETSQFETGLARMRKSTKDGVTGIQSDVAGINTSMSSLTATMSKLAIAFVSFETIKHIGTTFIETARKIDELVDSAEKVGASANQFSILSIAAKKNGTDLEAVRKGYIALQKASDAAAGGNKDTVKSFNDLGISYREFAKLKPDERFMSIADALKSVNDENERTTLGVALLGKSYNELRPMLAGGSTGLKGYAATPGVISNADAKKIEQLYKNFEGIGNILAGEIQKSLIEMAPILTKMVEFTKMLIENWKVITVLVAAAFAPSIVEKFTFQVIRLYDYIKAMLVAARLNNYMQFAVTARGPMDPSGLGRQLTQFQSTVFTVSDKISAKLEWLWTSVGAFFARITTLVAASGISLTATIAIAFGGFLAAYGVFLLGFKKLFDGFAWLADRSGETGKQAAKDAREWSYQFGKAYDDMVEFIPKKVIKDTSGPSEELEKEAQRIKKALANMKTSLTPMAKFVTGDEYLKDMWKDIGANAIKESDAYKTAMDSFAQATIDAIRLPSEVAQDEIEKLNNSVLFGSATLEDTQKRIDDILKKVREPVMDYLATPYEQAQKKIEEAMNNEEISFEEFIAYQKKVGEELVRSAVDYISTPIEIADRKIKELTNNIGKGLSPEQLAASIAKIRKESIASLADSVATPQEKYDEQLRKIRESSGPGGLSTSQVDKLNTKAQTDMWKEMAGTMAILAEQTNNFADGMSRAIVEGTSLGDVFKKMMADIAMMIVRYVILASIMAMVGLLDWSAGAKFSKGLASMTGFKAIGTKANGGRVEAGMPTRVNELGQEIFIPQTSGVIIPHNQIGGLGGTSVQQVFNVSAGVAQSVRAEMAQYLPIFKAQTMAGIMDASQRGGQFPKAIRGAA